MEEEQSEPKGASEQAVDAEETSESRSIEKLQAEYDALNDRYLRLAADFDNYKKRMARDLESSSKYALEQFVVELLEVIDNLERAASADDAGLREGLEQIRKMFGAILKRHSIVPIECCNRPFDPSAHEAIAYIASDADEGLVIDEAVRGYCMHDKVIRCAKVVVSKGKD